ncbi:unnamed protein product [Closterium sp. NIES-64]|nr:unnamed protein product [Closterium sp. NIES-64]
MASGWREGIQWEDPSSMASRDDYIVHDGRRYVKPYFFQFVAHVKQRWHGRHIAELFASEFRQRPLQYYEEAVRVGRIQVDGRNVAPDYAVRQSQTMTHYVHRHAIVPLPLILPLATLLLRSLPHRLSPFNSSPSPAINVSCCCQVRTCQATP